MRQFTVCQSTSSTFTRSRIRRTTVAAALSVAAMLFFVRPAPGADAVPMRLVSDPSVSPTGDRIAFSWIDEIWSADIDGQNVRRLTSNTASDTSPLFSPDGTQIAFVSDRTGSDQIFLMQTDGTNLRQITFHTAGYSLSDWFPDGNSILALGSRDHFHRDATRMIKVNVQDRAPEEILVNAMAEDAKISPDGKKILFTREGERWWRKGYQGERSAQVWMYDLESGEFEELLHEGVECMWPTWMPNGRGFYFTRGELHGFDLWQYRFAKNENAKPKLNKVVGFDDDSIVFPEIARNGSTLVFRHLFDLYKWNPKKKKQQPQKIELVVDSDVDLPSADLKRELSAADEAAFSKDGLEVAFISGGDVWVMDTELREPMRVTSTAGYEDDLVFSPDGNELWFTSSAEGQVDIWKATRQDSDKYWWLNEQFDLEQITNDAHVEGSLRFTPDGKQLVYQQGRGDLAVLDADSQEKRILVTGFSGIDFDIASDGNWIAYSQQNNDFNSEIWITKLDGSMEPVNVSRHPDNEYGPRFSPDGKILAFTGRRIDQETDIYYLYLQAASDQETSRQRQMEEAIAKMKKNRKAPGPKEESKGRNGDDKSEKDSEEAADDKDDDSDEDGVEPIQIDFDGIHERLRRISIPDSRESNIFFSPDGKKMVFNASIDGERGWYTVEFPDELTPKLLTQSTGSGAVWTKEAGAILCLRNGTPTRVDASGKSESYAFEAPQHSDRAGWLRAGFLRAWLTMREAWYDPSFANHNWDSIRRKYASVAAQMHSPGGLGSVVELMLGELNGSHLGFYPSRSGNRDEPEGWVEQTAHLGVRFDDHFNGPGLKVKDVIPDGPADREDTKLLAGDVILSIDGKAVDPAMDLTLILNGRLDRNIVLAVRREAQDEDADEADDVGEGPSDEINVTIRPTSYARIRSLLYDKWLEQNRQTVDQASEGKLGYLHIRAMDMGSFYEFERQLYNVGYGREGLVIDVRDNGGGSTTDLLLTALTQPRHAITVPRGGGRGYPHDRAVFASWDKPIIVLCNQNSYSNAEIFSHSIKTLKRGKVVGVQTAGGVISTGAAQVNDVGRIRVPFRGWFLINDGEDMERNGCLPDTTIWPHPGELPAGHDRQLSTAVEMLLAEMVEKEPVDLIYAAERDLQDQGE